MAFTRSFTALSELAPSNKHQIMEYNYSVLLNATIVLALLLFVVLIVWTNKRIELSYTYD